MPADGCTYAQAHEAAKAERHEGVLVEVRKDTDAVPCLRKSADADLRKSTEKENITTK